MLVNKEIALGLKKIGFDELCWNVSSAYSDLPIPPAKSRWPNGIRNSDLAGFPERKDYDNSHACTRPDKYQVFAWFRKKYLYHCIDLFADGCVNYLTACVYDYRGDYAVQIFLKSDSSHSPQAFPMDYEKLEDICILKMIELHG